MLHKILNFKNNPFWLDVLPSIPTGVTVSPQQLSKVLLPLWISAVTPPKSTFSFWPETRLQELSFQVSAGWPQAHISTSHLVSHPLILKWKKPWPLAPACWACGASGLPDDLWIASGILLLLSWRIVCDHSWIVLCFGLISSKKSMSSFIFPTFSVSLSPSDSVSASISPSLFLVFVEMVD